MPDQIKKYIVAGIGCIISGVAINAFMVPHQLLSGGVSGVAMIFYFLFSTPIGLMSILLNIPLFILAYKMMDKHYVIFTLYGLTVFSLSIDATKFISTLNIIDDTMLAAIYGGAISGIGAGMVYRSNGSTGGTDIIGGILKKYYGLNIGSVNFFINCGIMTISATLFGLKPAMYTLLCMFVAASLADKVTEGFNRKKNLIIITDNSEEIAQDIISEVGRGVTYLHGEGAFTKQDKKVIFVVCTLLQITRVKTIVERHDPYAFMIVQDAAEVLGRGFTYKLK